MSGVKQAWRLRRLSSLTVPDDLKRRIIEAAARRRGGRVVLYAWQVEDGRAVQAFLAKSHALADWMRAMSPRRGGPGPVTLILRRWHVEARRIPSHIRGGKVVNVSVPDSGVETVRITVPDRSDLAPIAGFPGLRDMR